MQNNLIKNSIVLGLIVLFIGVTVQPCIAIVQPETELDVEPKYYLFQTIIDIANNPEVNILFELYRNDLYRVDVDRSVYRKLLLRNPRLFSSLIFTKPSLTYEYLDKSYTNGIEITSIIGEDKALEFIEVIKITDSKVFDELNSIIMNNEELSVKLATLKEMNNELKQDAPLENYSKLCAILMGIALAFLFPCGWCYILYQIFYENPILRKIFSSIGMITGAMFFTLGYIFGALCYGFPPHW